MFLPERRLSRDMVYVFVVVCVVRAYETHTKRGLTFVVRVCRSLPSSFSLCLSLPLTGIELNQGDTIGGTVGRGDVAEVVVEAALSPVTENTIFEIYGEKERGREREGVESRDNTQGKQKKKNGVGKGNGRTY